MNQRKFPLISICIPTYNRSSYLKECLDCIIYQDGFDHDLIEIIISDNASTDNTRIIGELYNKNYSNIHYFTNNINIGANLNLFKVSEYATGDYIWFMGDDDKILNGGLRNVLNSIQTTNDIVLFQTNSLESSDEMLIAQDGINYFKKIIYESKIHNLIVFMLFLSMVIVKRADFSRNLQLYRKEFPHKLAEAYSHFYILIRCISNNKIALLGEMVSGGEGNKKDKGYFKNNSRAWYDLVIINGIDKIYEDIFYLNSIGIINKDLDIYRSNFIKVYYLNICGNFFKNIGLYSLTRSFYLKFFKKLI